MKVLLCAALAFGLPVACAAETSSRFCEPNPAIREKLNRLDEDARKLTGPGRAEQRKTLAAHALAADPEDFFVNLRYQAMARGRKQTDRDAMIARYRSLADRNPQDPKFTVLYARSLMGADTPRAIELLKKTVTGEMAPWAYLTLADIHSYGKFADRPQLRKELLAYFDACPASVDARALSMLARFGETGAIATRAVALRARLTAETSNLPRWEDLWNLEFKARPVPEHEALRKQIQADLKRLEEVAPKNARSAGVIISGYKMVGDASALQQAEDRLLDAYPDTTEARAILRQRWSKEHPYPKPDDPDEKKEEYYRAQLANAESRLKASPQEFEYLQQRFGSLQQLKSSTAEQVEAAGDAMLEALRKGADWYSVPPEEFQVARALLKRKHRVERVPDLVAQGMKNFAEGELKDDRYPDEAQDGGNGFYVKMEQARILIEAAEVLKQPALPKAVVAELDSVKAEKPYTRISLLDIRGRFAELEGRKLDALLLFRAAIEARPADFKAPKKDDLAENLARLRKELGGTDATKDLWERNKKIEVAEAGWRWETPKKPMPKWELTDLAGKTWKLTSLEGKTLLVNVWATWCGPCRAEHPYLEKLYQKVKDRSDVQVVSFNVDTEIGAVAPYMKENKYTFPALLAGAYVDDLIPSLSIPRNWIVDSKGEWRLEQIGFGGDETWEKDMIDKIEGLKPVK